MIRNRFAKQFAAYDESYGRMLDGKWQPHRVTRIFDTKEERDNWVAYNPLRRGVLPDLLPEPEITLEEALALGWKKWRDQDPMGSMMHYIAKEVRACGFGERTREMTAQDHVSALVRMGASAVCFGSDKIPSHIDLSNLRSELYADPHRSDE